MVLFPHLSQGLRPTPTRGAWSCRRSFLVVPLLMGIGFVGFGLLGGADVVPANYRPAFDLTALIGSAPSPSSTSSLTASPPAAPTYADPHAPVDTSPEKDHLSSFSFDINGGPDAGRFRSWMADAPDNLSLAHMSIPGTHDTMTHRVNLLGYRCQNADLRKQLDGGVRYLDIRARVQVDPAHDDDDQPGSDAPRPLGIYHGRAYTGYGFADVVQTVADFLADEPSETIVMRVKEEGPPLKGAAGDAPGLAPDDGGGAPVEHVPSRSGSPFLDAFQHYLLDSEETATAGQLAAHLFGYAEAKTGHFDLRRIPTLGELRGKVLLLQEFPYYPQERNYTAPGVPMYGIPWQLESDLLAVEDKWQMRNLDDLDNKWDAVRANLRAAAYQAAHPPPGSDPNPKLHLSHLSASVGVTPIDAAAGPTNHSITGINDRTGVFVERGKDLYNDDYPDGYTPIGIVMADFPGMRLMQAIVKRNKHLST